MPVYQKHLERAGAWNIFRNNFEEYATTNETDFMGSVTMSPASGRQICDTSICFKSSLTFLSRRLSVLFVIQQCSVSRQLIGLSFKRPYLMTSVKPLILPRNLRIYIEPVYSNLKRQIDINYTCGFTLNLQI